MYHSFEQNQYHSCIRVKVSEINEIRFTLYIVQNSNQIRFHLVCIGKVVITTN